MEPSSPKLKIDDGGQQTYTQGSFWIAKATMPYHFETKTGKSKKQEWLMIEGVPCICVGLKDDTIFMNSFTSSKDRTFAVDKCKMSELFDQAVVDNDCIVAPKYPFPIPINEFDIRDTVGRLQEQLTIMVKQADCAPMVKKIIEDKLSQVINAQGVSYYITIPEYEQYKNGEIVLSGHKRFGNEIFNRNCRWCPPVDISYDEFVASPSYPAPLGIRPKDFCLPSELISTLIEMVTQIYNMPNINKKSFDTFNTQFQLEERSEHCCKYCGNCIDSKDYSSEYKSETNFMEICHRNPNDRFLASNMYWGHGECNRKQGGYSETDRKHEGLRLMLIHDEITKELYDQLISSIKSC